MGEEFQRNLLCWDALNFQNSLKTFTEKIGFGVEREEGLVAPPSGADGGKSGMKKGGKLEWVIPERLWIPLGSAQGQVGKILEHPGIEGGVGVGAG